MTTKRFIEITAKSNEEALELAKRELKEGEAITGSEVLQAPARGIFGVVGNPETRVRFTFEQKPLEPPRPAPEPPRPAHRPEPRADRPRPQPARPAPEAEAADEAGDLDDLETADDLEELPADEDYGGESETPRSRPAPQPEEPGIDVGQDPRWPQIHELLQEVAQNLEVTEVTFKTYPKDGNSVVEAAGNNVSQLIGKHGRTLDALQYLLNIMFNKGRDDRAKLILDVQGYRDKRLKNLIMLANRMYRKVIDSGRQVELEPMSTLDRRTVHLALKDRAGIETYSRGVEPMRRVVIAPKKGGSGFRPRGDRGDRGPRREDGGRSDNNQSRPKSVPMFLEEDGSNEG